MWQTGPKVDVSLNDVLKALHLLFPHSEADAGQLINTMKGKTDAKRFAPESSYGVIPKFQILDSAFFMSNNAVVLGMKVNDFVLFDAAVEVTGYGF